LGEKFIPPSRREAQEAPWRKENVQWTFLAKGRVGAPGIIQDIQGSQAAFLFWIILGEKFIPPSRREAQEAPWRKENVQWTFLAKGRVGAPGIIQDIQGIQTAFLFWIILGENFIPPSRREAQVYRP
jgi:hypothetical protein